MRKSEVRMTGWEQVKAMLRSRKFWAMVISVVTAGAGLATAQIDVWQCIMAVVAAMAAYSTGVAIEDAGEKAARTAGGAEVDPPVTAWQR